MKQGKSEKNSEQTSSSAKVNRCLRITTLSHLELVSAIVDGSSSSQSASLLIHMHPILAVLSDFGNGIETHLFSFWVFLIIFFLSLLLVLVGASFCTL